MNTDTEYFEHYFTDADSVRWRFSPEGLMYKCAGGAYKTPRGPFEVPGPLVFRDGPHPPNALGF